MPPKKAEGFPRHVVGASETYYQRGLKYDECHKNYANFLKFNAEALARLREAVIQVEKGEIEITKRCAPMTDRGEEVHVKKAANYAELSVIGADCEEYIKRFFKELPIDHLIENGDSPVFDGAPHILIPTSSGFLAVKENAPIKGTRVGKKVYDAAGKVMYDYKKGDNKAACRRIDIEDRVQKQGYSFFEWRITSYDPDMKIPEATLLFDHLGLYRGVHCTTAGITSRAIDSVSSLPLPPQVRGKKYWVDAMGRYMVINAANKDCPIVLSKRHWDGQFREDLIPKEGKQNPPYLTVSRTVWKKMDRSYKNCVTCGMAFGKKYCLPSYKIKSIDFRLPNIARPVDLRTAMGIRPNDYHLCYACAHSLDDDVFKQTGIVLERFECGGKDSSAVEHLARSGFDYSKQGDNLILYLGEHKECYAVPQGKDYNARVSSPLAKILSECALDRFPYSITNVQSWSIVPSAP